MKYFSSAAAAWLLLAIFASFVSASSSSGGLHQKQIKNLVTFGDSYTDVIITGDAGVAWPIYAAGYAKVSLYPYARAGASCSNNVTFRPWPSVFESQLPLYLEEKHNGSLKLNPKETLYTLWIGTNDIGAGSLVSGSNSASIVDVAGCMVNWVNALYQSGARNFLFQNMIPLEKTPIYSPNAYPDRYWSGARNSTQWSDFIRQLVLSGNALTKLMLQDLASTLHDSRIAIFDSHALFTDMYANPARYLNGTAPLNVTGAISSCVFEVDATTGECTTVTDKAAQDSFLWYDELHPSEQADRIVAREIATIIEGGKNKWTTWLN